jgi:hypothetical protein
MYIRTTDQAVEALAGVLDQPDRRAQIVQATVQVMMCVHEEPRRFLADAQALLIQGGLEALRRRRQEALDSLDSIPLIVLDPEGDRLFEAVAAALDALRLSDAVRQVFPDLLHARWIVARALLAREAELRSLLAAGVRAHGDPGLLRSVGSTLETLISARQPAWADSEETLRNACEEILRGAGLVDAFHLEAEAAALFEVIAVSDEHVLPFLDNLGAEPAEAVQLALRLYEALDAVRRFPASEGPAAREAAA